MYLKVIKFASLTADRENNKNVSTIFGAMTFKSCSWVHFQFNENKPIMTVSPKQSCCYILRKTKRKRKMRNKKVRIVAILLCVRLLSHFERYQFFIGKVSVFQLPSGNVQINWTIGTKIFHFSYDKAETVTFRFQFNDY